MGWWTRLLDAGGRRRVPDVAAARAPARPVSTLFEDTLADRPGEPLAPPAPLLPWLVHQPGPAPGDVSTPAERRALARIDDLISRPGTPADALPRARSVMPQLLAMLRREDIGSEAVAQQVGRDPALTAQVLRLASAAAPVDPDRPPSLRQALDRIGRVGLNSAIAHGVMQPMFSPDGQGLAARAGARLWLHAQRKAEHCSALAHGRGIDAFEGYLAGLLHNSGITIALHEIDRCGPMAATAVQNPAHIGFTSAFSDALVARSDVLFGLAAAGWAVTPMLDAVAATCAGPGGLRNSPLPLAQLLCQADDMATRELAGPASLPTLT